MECFLKNAPEKLKTSEQLILLKKSCLILINKFVHVPNPPMPLLAVCLRCLSKSFDEDIFKAFVDSGLFPQTNTLGDASPGLIGKILNLKAISRNFSPTLSIFRKFTGPTRMCFGNISFDFSIFGIVIQEIPPSFSALCNSRNSAILPELEIQPPYGTTHIWPKSFGN